MSSLLQSELSLKFNSFNERIVERLFGILWDINNDTLKLNLITKGFFDFRSIGFFESLFARNKVIDSRFLEEEIKLGRFTSYWSTKTKNKKQTKKKQQKKRNYIQENFN